MLHTLERTVSLEARFIVGLHKQVRIARLVRLSGRGWQRIQIHLPSNGVSVSNYPRMAT